jgi:hypothetical protein
MDKQDLINRLCSKPGKTGKVNAKCVECIYDEKGGAGTWRQQIKACTAYTCPLWEIRPMPEESDA